jgi:alpha-beta hydrolase superfamily lysophospholipase
MAALSAARFSVVAIDLRGHGYSEGKRGYIDSMQQYLDDVDAAVEHAKAEFGFDRVILLAHSMGALVATHYANAYQSKLLGLALSCPLMGIKVKVPLWKAKLGEVMSTYMPSFKLASTIDAADLTHDVKKADVYRQDSLIFHHVTARWFSEILKSQEESLHFAPALKLPLLLQLSDPDKIVDSEQSKVWYDLCKMKDKTQLIYKGFFHEIYNETERQKPISDMVDWLKDRWSKKNSTIVSTQSDHREGLAL